MSDLNDLYQEIIIDHNKHPCNCHSMADCTSKAEGYNPLCGDQIEVFVKKEGDLLTDVSFVAQGCAISKASASLMTTYTRGKAILDVEKLAHEVSELLTSVDEPVIQDDHFGDLVALIGVRKFPARVKCATLAWHALEACLHGENKVSTE